MSKVRLDRFGQGRPSIYVCYASNSDRSAHHNEPTLRANTVVS